MALFLKENLKITTSMEKGSCDGPIIEFTKETGNLTKWMEMAFLDGKTGGSIKVSIRTTENMELDGLNMRMGMFMKANGPEGSRMAKEN